MTEQEQNGSNQDVKRWIAKRKAALVLGLIKGGNHGNLGGSDLQITNDIE